MMLVSNAVNTFSAACIQGKAAALFSFGEYYIDTFLEVKGFSHKTGSK